MGPGRALPCPSTSVCSSTATAYARARTGEPHSWPLSGSRDEHAGTSARLALPERQVAAAQLLTGEPRIVDGARVDEACRQRGDGHGQEQGQDERSYVSRELDHEDDGGDGALRGRGDEGGGADEGEQSGWHPRPEERPPMAQDAAQQRTHRE